MQENPGQTDAALITNYTGPDGNLTYGYDHAGQLLTVSGAHSESSGYDANRNRNTSGYTVGTGNQIITDPAGNTFNYLGGNSGPALYRPSRIQQGRVKRTV